MCGFAGLIHLDSRRTADRTLLEAMNARLVHRGPDGEGVFVSGPMGLAARRLAIVDLHPRGNQPMSNAAGDCHIVANCEIYNYREHRRSLENSGYRFTSQTDTEVILALYERHGERCVDYLRGMFAFAIWDERRRKLFMARDRFGQKPLYYAQHDDTVWFGSEIKALLADPNLPRDTNPVALYRFLAFRYIPAPDTAFKHIRKLLPAHTLVVVAASSSVRNSGIGTGFSSPPFAALRWALIAVRRKLVTVTPGMACGYWNARKRPRCARSSAPSSETSCPSRRIWPSVISYAG